MPGYWSGLVYYRGRVTPLRVRSWRGAFTTPPHGPEFAAGSGFECKRRNEPGLSPPTALEVGTVKYNTKQRGKAGCICWRGVYYKEQKSEGEGALELEP